jgi:F-type H+-transporting ATPase subunit delta
VIYRRIARRYAAALFRAAGTPAAVGAPTAAGAPAAASDQDVVDRIAQDLQSACKDLAADSALSATLAHPEIPSPRKQAILQAVFGGLAPLSLTFLTLLVQRRRQSYLAYIIDEYRHMADAARGLVRAQVVSAVAMSSEQEQRLRRALERRTGKRVEITPTVDPSLLAGLMVNMDNEVIDASARGRLDRMRELLVGARFRGLGQ